MNIKSIIFMLAILFINFAVHLAVYIFVLKLFQIESRTHRIFLGLSMLVLSLSFIMSAFLVRFSNSLPARIIYDLAAFWLGLVMIMFLFLLAGFCINFLLKIFGIDWGFWIGLFSVALALTWALWGVWNAKHPIIKELEVGVRNLPSAWENKKILQISDVHLGRSNGKNFAKMLVAKINSEKPDLVFITGDLFDGMGSSVDEFIPVLEKIEASQGMYFVTGNHEGYLGSKAVVDKLKKTKIRVLENELAEIDGVQIVGLSYPEHHDSQDRENVLEEVAGFDTGKPSILLYHVPTNLKQQKKDMAQQQSQAYWKPDTDYSLAKNSGIDLQLSGHTHGGQFFPFTWIGKRIFNGFNFGLITEGDFNLYISSGVGTWGPPIRTASDSEIVSIKLHKKQ